jgi:hypothetical protein
MLPTAPTAAERPARVRSIEGCWLGNRYTSSATLKPMQPATMSAASIPPKAARVRRIAGATAPPRKPAKGAADPRLGDAVGEDRVVGGVIDAVGKAGQDGGDQQPWIGADEGDGEEGEAAEDEAGDQHRTRADAVDQEAGRRLRQAGDDVEGGERQPEIEEADVEPLLEQRQQHRQHHNVEMADEVRRRDRQQRLRLAAGGGNAGQALRGVGGHWTFGWALCSASGITGPARAV